MEKEILEILKSIQESQNAIVKRLDNLEEGQKRIESKIDGITDQTADLTEFRTAVVTKLDELKEVEEVTKVNCYDIAKLKAVK
ncbi:MAG: hypothetical protein ACRDB9_00950 [Cetobacterium sp.]